MGINAQPILIITYILSKISRLYVHHLFSRFYFLLNEANGCIPFIASLNFQKWIANMRSFFLIKYLNIFKNKYKVSKFDAITIIQVGPSINIKFSFHGSNCTTPKTAFDTYQMRLEVGTPRFFAENDINSCTKSSTNRLLDIDTHLVK
jgi:hypothetical protein